MSCRRCLSFVHTPFPHPSLLTVLLRLCLVLLSVRHDMLMRSTVIRLPWSIIHSRYLTPRKHQPAFLRTASPFEDVVVRCVRYAFAHIPPRIGRVFFAREVALPFLRFRLLRHGYRGWPVGWREYREVTTYAVVGGWRAWVGLVLTLIVFFLARVSWHLDDQKLRGETGFGAVLRSW